MFSREWKWGFTVNGTGNVLGEGHGSVLKQNWIVVIAHLCEFTKKSLNYTLRMGEFTVWKLYLNKAVLKGENKI